MKTLKILFLILISVLIPFSAFAGDNALRDGNKNPTLLLDYNTATKRAKADSNGYLLVNTDSGITADVNVAEILGTATAVNSGVASAGTLRIISAIDDPGVISLGTIDDTVYVDDGDWIDNSSKHLLIGGLYQSSPQSITDGDVGPLQISSNGELIITGDVDIISQGASLSRKESSQDLGSTSLNYTTNFAAETRIKQILLTASTNITETVTFNFNSITNSNYDTTLASEDLISEANYSYMPGADLDLLSGDEITITCTNNNTTGTVYVTIVGEALN